LRRGMKQAKLERELLPGAVVVDYTDALRQPTPPRAPARSRHTPRAPTAQRWVRGIAPGARHTRGTLPPRWLKARATVPLATPRATAPLATPAPIPPLRWPHPPPQATPASLTPRDKSSLESLECFERIGEGTVKGTGKATETVKVSAESIRSRAESLRACAVSWSRSRAESFEQCAAVCGAVSWNPSQTLYVFARRSCPAPAPASAPGSV
jgi:hypothetical protein